MTITKTFDEYYNYLLNQIDYFENREDAKLFSGTIRRYKSRLRTAKRHEFNSNFVIMSLNRVTFKYTM